MKLRIATRRSPLALWQARHVAAELTAHDPELEVELVEMVTQGDKILDQALSKVGGKDLFVKEIEQALIDGSADVAVHSLKDMPTKLPEGLTISAHPPREDPRDAWVSKRWSRFFDVPEGGRIGTSSLRRSAQLLRHRPDLKIEVLRGNVQTRLARMEERGLDGTLLAHAGLVRLGMASAVSDVFPTDVLLPAVGQGILAVEVRADDEATWARCRALDDGPSRAAATAERCFLDELQGGCQVPIGGHATVEGGQLELVGMVCSLDGKTVHQGIRNGPVADAEALGRSLAQELLGQGADVILRALLD